MTTRTLTVLFTDIVGSTRLFGTLDRRDGARLLSAHFAVLHEQIVRRGGLEVKGLGDGVMATFDSARDAIECAIAIQQGLGQLATTDGGVPLSVRIGLSSGDVRTEGGDCFGTPVIEASRLCARAAGGQVLVADATRLLARDYATLVEIGDLQLKGLPEPARVWEAPWSPDTLQRVRVVLADDAVLVREGIAHILDAAGIEVVGQAGDGEELLRLVADTHPDLAIVDVRMPPTHTDEGVLAAIRIRAQHPETGVLVLTMDIEPRYASRLLAASASGVGYLLKESVTDMHEFVDAARRVAGGGTAFDPTVLPSLNMRATDAITEAPVR